MSPAAGCPTCGRALDEHDQDFRFGLPDPVLELPDRERTPGTWLSDETPSGLGTRLRRACPRRAGHPGSALARRPLGAPVRAQVRDPDQLPYCAATAENDLARLLTREWPHEPVLRAVHRAGPGRLS